MLELMTHFEPANAVHVHLTGKCNSEISGSGISCEPVLVADEVIL